MTLRSIGPVPVRYRAPSLSWTSDPRTDGSRDAQISGLVEWTKAQQLTELVANPHRRMTIGGKVGVLEYVVFDGDLVGDFRGWYLISSFEFGRVEHQWSVQGNTGPVPFSINASYLGDSHRQPVIARSARARDNDYDVVAQDLITDPFWSGDAAPFVVGPAASVRILRPYDTRSPHVPDASPVPGYLSIYVGNMAGEHDFFPPIALPDFPATDVERWNTRRGNDVRVYDRREGREVYGPSHPIVDPGDVLVTNGLIRFWTGPRGTAPFLHVAAFGAGIWDDVGTVGLARPGTNVTLRSARLVRMTPDYVTIAITIDTLGDCFVTLRRGERMLRVAHGSERSPAVNAGRYVRWDAFPPTKSFVANGVPDDGRYGRGLALTPAVPYDVTFDWPAPATPAATTLAGWWTPNNSSTTQGDSGIFEILDSDDVVVGTVTFANTGDKIRLVIGAPAIETGALTFAAATPVFVEVRLSNTAATLSVGVLGGALTHTTGVITAPSDLAHLRLGAADGSTWGSGTWGSGTWGGGIVADGTYDNLMIFADVLTDAETAALFASTSRFGGLPDPESRLIWSAPLNTPVPQPQPFTAGRLEDVFVLVMGATPTFTRLVAGLVGVATVDGVGVGSGGTTVELMAALCTGEVLDTAVNVACQFVADSEQELRVR